MAQLPDNLSILEDSIRHSVLADRYESTAGLLTRYTEAVEARLHAAPSELPALKARASDLLQWVGQLVQISREESLVSMAHLQQLSRYRSCPSSQRLYTDA